MTYVYAKDWQYYQFTLEQTKCLAVNYLILLTLPVLCAMHMMMYPAEIFVTQ